MVTLSSDARDAAPLCLTLTSEEVALLRASAAFNARYLSDPALRARLERAATKLGQLLGAQPNAV
jgi:hypothetical protein